MTAKQDMRAVACEILLALGRPYESTAYKVAVTPQWWTVLPEGRDPSDFSCPEEYFKSAVASSLWKKYKDFEGSKQKCRAAAIEKWHDAEQQCYRTNRRFASLLPGSLTQLDDDPGILAFCESVKKEVKTVVGTVPNVLHGHFGPGSTFETRGKYQCAIPSKIGSVPTMTSNAWPFVSGFSKTAWARSLSQDGGQRLFNVQVDSFGVPYDNRGTSLEMPVVRGNRYDTVPKNVNTDRSIGIEPALNVFYQLAVGSHLKKRLQTYGQLLVPEHWDYGETGSESQGKHRVLAAIASRDGSLCTIDLSAASDTIAYSVVEYLLPPRWFSVLAALRSPTTLIDGKHYHLEKFSSMGNGYTFELETLIFFCICRAVLRFCGSDVSNVNVYGDDIIVPTDCYRSVTAALRFFGFRINAGKSFHTGPFRESCGGDYFRGVDVRPPSIKGEPSSPLDWIVIYNQLKRLEGRVIQYHLGRALEICTRNIPRHLRLFGPQALGDTVLHDDSNEQRWTTSMRFFKSGEKNYRRASRTMHIQCVLPIAQKLPWSRWDATSAAVSRLYGLYGSDVPLRGNPAGWTVGWVPIPWDVVSFR